MMRKTRAVPNLRFPEFRDAGPWEVKPLGDVGKRVTGKNRDLNYTRVLTNSAVKGIVDQRNYFDKDIANKNNLTGYLVVRKGDYAYNPRVSSNAPVGPIGRNNIGTGIMSPLYIIFRFHGDDSNYYEYYFCTSFWHDYIRAVGSSGARHDRMSLSVSDFINIPILEPCVEEKQKIADCLTSVDDLIMAQEQKLEALKAHKKGLMQQLFPPQGESTPRRRFPEFRDAGDWEEKRLGQLGELVSGLTYSPDDVRREGLLVLRSSNVQNGVVVLEDNVFVAPEVKGANLSKPGDILICVRNGSKALIGKNALLPKGLPLCTHGAFMTVFRAEFSKFVFQLFQTNAYKSQVAADLGATINSINGRHLKNYTFHVPHPHEQQKIADCLTSVDDLIAVEAQKVKALKAHKEGLMQQLFPASDEVGG